MLIPYSTDAPVYHWPSATVGLIVANMLVFLGVASGALPFDPDTGGPWVLEYGVGLWPTQWLGSAFMHAGVFHLASNMIALWTFGLVVEGKLGWKRYLPLYLTLAVGESALEQTLMLGASGGGSLGASSAIMGVLAIAAVWAPDNDFECFYWVLVVAGTTSIPILGVAVFYVAFDLGLAMLIGGLGGGVTSSLLHLMGVAVGLPIGVLMLKRGVVDCEGWDVFSRYGDARKRAEKAEREEAEDAARRTEAASARNAQTLDAARTQFDQYLDNDAPVAAAKLYDKLRDRGGWRLDPQRLRRLVKALHAEQRWAEAAPRMAELIEADPDHADPVRVALAQVCLRKLQRPGRALELLAGVDPSRINATQRGAARSVAAEAEAQLAEGAVELDDDAW